MPEYTRRERLIKSGSLYEVTSRDGVGLGGDETGWGSPTPVSDSSPVLCRKANKLIALTKLDFRGVTLWSVIDASLG